MVTMVANTTISFFLTRAAYRYWGFANNPDYVSAFGSFCIGIVGNAYSRKFGGTAFTAMLTGVVLLVPEGLATAGGIAVNYHQKTDGEYVENLDLARRSEYSFQHIISSFLENFELPVSSWLRYVKTK